jgi:putative flippase GtrA
VSSARSSLDALLGDQRIRYLISGSFVAGLYIVVFAVLTRSFPQVNYLVLLLAAQAVIMSVAFPLYRRFVFRSQGGLAEDLSRFSGVWGFNILLGTALIALLVSVLHVQPNLAQVVTIALVTVSSFLGHRFVSFRHRHDHAPAATGALEDPVGLGRA